MISHRMIPSALPRLVKCTWGRFVIRWPRTGRCGGRAQGVASGDDRKVPRPQTIVAVMPGSLPLALPSRQAPGLTSRTSIFHLGLRIARNSQKLVHQKQKNQKRFLYGLVELCFAVHYESRSGRGGGGSLWRESPVHRRHGNGIATGQIHVRRTGATSQDLFAVGEV